MRRLVPVVAFVAVVAGWLDLGCYSPEFGANYHPNCSATGKKCPDGFECVGNVCYMSGTVSGQGGTGTGGHGGVVGTGGGPGTGGNVGSGGAGQCVGPLQIPQCANVPIPAGGACDPVCQAGCGCQDRCNVVSDKVTCKPAGGKKSVLEVCSVAPDDCAPGLICLGEFDIAKCGQHCYRHCRNDLDCGGRAHCTIALTFEGKELPWRVCDNPAEECNPQFGMAQCTGAGRPFPNFGCYIAGSQFPSEAVCDCAGTTTEDQPCAFERECMPGLTCVNAQDGGGARCRRVCNINATPMAKLAICGATRRCVTYQNSMRFGFCQPL